MLEHYLLFSSIGILLSMLFSSAEISLIRSNPLQINVWKKQNRIFAKYSSYLIKDKDKTLILILIGINFSNVIASSFLTLYLIDENRANPMPEELIIPFISLIILILAEVLPKTISKEYSNTSLLVLTPLLFVFKFLF